MGKIYYTALDTPIGMVWAAKTNKGLIQVHALSNKKSFLTELKQRVKGEYIQDHSKFTPLEEKLDTWAKNKPVVFDIPLDLRGTKFQVDVWKAIYKIPYGKLSSYGRIARDIGKPKASRAVGNAVGSNPCGIVIPCHRVIWSNGGLGGFGGGFDPERLNNKRKLLMIEGILPRVEGKPEKEVDLTRFFY